MAGFRSVGAVGKSIEAVLNVAFADDPPVASLRPMRCSSAPMTSTCRPAR